MARHVAGRRCRAAGRADAPAIRRKLIKDDDRFDDSRFGQLAIGARDVVERDERGTDLFGRDETMLDQVQRLARVVWSAGIAGDEPQIAEVKTRRVHAYGNVGRKW